MLVEMDHGIDDHGSVGSLKRAKCVGYGMDQVQVDHGSHGSSEAKCVGFCVCRCVYVGIRYVWYIQIRVTCVIGVSSCARVVSGGSGLDIQGSKRGPFWVIPAIIPLNTITPVRARAYNDSVQDAVLLKTASNQGNQGI